MQPAEAGCEKIRCATDPLQQNIRRSNMCYEIVCLQYITLCQHLSIPGAHLLPCEKYFRGAFLFLAAPRLPPLSSPTGLTSPFII